jgi:cell division protein FtsQ
MWDDAKALSGLSATLAVMATLTLVAALIAWGARHPAFAIREVVVTTPLKRASAPHLESVIREEVHGTFFTVDLAGARTALGRVAWVRGVALRRQWPGRLEVAIEEHEPLARFGDAALVNTFGETFVATHAGALPRFAGPDGYAGEIARRYGEWTAILAPLALEITDVAMSARGGWRLRAVAATGPVTLELGRDDASARLARFVTAYARTVGALARQGTRIEYVDLRYRNGFAARVPGFREAAAKAKG